MVEVTIFVREDVHISAARRAARDVAKELGMDKYEVAEVEISVSELATNLMRHAGGGTVELERVERKDQIGLRIICSDKGPGIGDVSRAMEEGFSTVGTMGSGLPAVKRMMDEMEIVSKPGDGTTVVVTKWIKKH